MKSTFQHAETSGPARRAVADHQAPHSIAYAAVPALQRKNPEDEELKMKAAMQLKSLEEEPFLQKKENTSPPVVNKTGMPDNLKTGIENLSGIAMDDVKVHYNSDKPVQLNALAYAQGTDIHIGHGQERHLPHEAWHVVQQKQGRVRPTVQAKGVAINDDKGLEKEADLMGAEAFKTKIDSGFNYESKSEKLINDSRTVQTKKTTPFYLDKKYPPKVDINYGEYKNKDDDAYKEFIYTKLEPSYKQNLDKGTRY